MLNCGFGADVYVKATMDSRVAPHYLHCIGHHGPLILHFAAWMFGIINISLLF